MKKGKVLALDYGTKRIGLASGDLEHKIAFPRDIILNKGDAIKRIFDLCKELDIVLVVVGWPLQMQEKRPVNPVMPQLKQFVKKLEKMGLKVTLLDERLSSFEAKKLTGESRNVDAHAAQIILQRYFDAL